MQLKTLVAALAAWLLVAPFASAQSSRSADAAPKSGAAALNLNTATAAQLEALPGIGARTAQLIVEFLIRLSRLAGGRL